MKNILLILIFFPSIVFGQEFIKYEKGIYSIEYPSNWILNDTGEYGSEIFIYPKNPEFSDIFIENINLTRQNLNDPTITIENYKNIVESQIGGMLTDHKVILSELENKNELKFHKFISEGILSDYKFKTVVYSWLLNEEVYSLTFITLKENYKNIHIESLGIMDSFKFIKN
jgi:hypothetical protein